MRHCVHAGQSRHSCAARLKERNQNCKRKDFVTGLCDLIVSKREPWLHGERTEPITVVIDEAPKLPLWKLKFEQREGCVGPRTGFDQPIDLDLRSGSERAE